ncbi:T4SS efffector SepA family protein [Roseobacter denitrificans]|uniref:T4SS efffector SepA family protein n=1 Tax=Roseobacter denitrificans TaxID=2434 RepID=UPI0008E1E37D|nr:hypothetical protein [Roseobacter denitrificans]SFG14476.1 hypothetical protein SAMN05443635_108138 [Roseobacter denitrificans OCh 114]
MQNIEVYARDFQRLQAFATPLVDSAATAFAKVLDIAEAAEAAKDSRSSRTEVELATRMGKHFGPHEVPPLRHTKVLEGSFAGREIEKPTWDALVKASLHALWNEHGEFRAVKNCSGANIVEGVKSDEGYKFLPELNLSYQGVSSDDAIEIAIRSARSLKQSLQIDFVWRDKKGAYLPGERARIKI